MPTHCLALAALCTDVAAHLHAAGQPDNAEAWADAAARWGELAGRYGLPRDAWLAVQSLHGREWCDEAKSI